MRRLLTIITILFVNIIAMAQAPSKMSYQAVIRSNNALVVSTQIGMRVSIIKDSATGLSVYQETYNPQPTTNANGLVSVEIGGGNPSFGLFENIDWSAATYFVKIETDVTGGTNYTNIGVSQLLSVPYALNAKSSLMVTGIVPVSNGGTGVTNINGIKILLGIDRLNNTPDSTKQISIATQDALDSKFDKIDTTLWNIKINAKASIDTPSFNGVVTTDKLVIGVNQNDSSAALEINSTTQGLLFPRLTYEQRNKIKNPTEGLSIYCRDCGLIGELQIYNGTTWYHISGAAAKNPLPIVTTANITSVTNSTATSGGRVLYDGGTPLSKRGVVYGTLPLPGTNYTGTKTINGTDTGIFVSNITGLSANTTYYLRAYATNATGTAYGAEYSFTATPSTLPTDSTFNATNISYTTASVAAKIKSNGGIPITAAGVCYATTTLPTTANSKVTYTNYTVGTKVTVSLQGLNGATTYYARAYATNSVGTAYGNEISFTTIQQLLPTLSTQPTTSILSTSVVSGLNLITDGGATVTSRGVCYSTSPNPTILSSKKNGSGTNLGVQSVTITGLSPNTTYYVKAFSTNIIGTAYGNEVSFTTAKSAPVISTVSAATSITANSAVSGGNVLLDGGYTVTKRGVCWSQGITPTIADSISTNGNGVGAFVSNLTNLLPNRTYYVRAYATNSMGTTYSSNTISFTTPITTPTILYTKPAVIIKGASAISGGDSIISNGGTNIISRGICWSTSNNPTIQDSITIDGNTSTNYYECDLRNLNPNTTYYVRSYASNSLYTGYGPVRSFQTTNVQLYEVYQGGYVAMIFQPGDVGYIANQVHGLILAKQNISNSLQWYNGTNTTIGATSLLVGSGNSNTNTIVSSQGTGSYAAKACSDLVLLGYSDWYLPSKDELYRISQNGFLDNGANYWTSSEINSSSAWAADRNNYLMQPYSKSSLLTVRPVRTF
jgi:hypothetical protein